MRAAVLHGVNESLRVEQRPDLSPAPGEAVVQVHAAALNHRDVWIRKGQYAGLKFPIVLGSDGAGTVASVGDPGDEDWVGKEVLINPSLGWGTAQRAQDLKSFNILGLPIDGTFAEQVAVPVSNLVVKPDDLSMHHAAALPLAGLTAYRALFSRARLGAGETVLVTGAGGGVSTFAIAFAAAAGAKVFVTSGSADKIDRAKQRGASGGAIYRDGDWDRQLKETAGGFDVIVDSIAGETYAKLIDLANPGGRIVSYGATTGNPPGIDARRVFWKQLSLLGSTMGSPEDFKAMIGFVSQHRIQPAIDRKFPLDQTNEALDHMEHANQCGKIVIEILS